MSEPTETPGIALNTAQGFSVWVPATLNCVTTYIVLEQEAWFEYEADFVTDWLQPGMTAIDVGASYGLYALAMARKVGPTGKVHAFEPSGEPRAFLERSRTDNGLDNLTVSPLALSDRAGERTLFTRLSSEFNTLGTRHEETVSAETVAVSSLDAQQAAIGWDRLDFIKIDAEGEEKPILTGAAKTLKDHSPLVMMEIAHEGSFQLDLPEVLQAIGYDTYRLTGDRSMLVPWDPEEFDPYTLNIFAAKPDRAGGLAQAGLLARQAEAPSIEEAPFTQTWRAIEALPYSAAYGAARQAGDEDYLSAIAAYFLWKDTRQPPEQRYGALRRALDLLQAECARTATIGRLSTLARVAFDGGWRGLAIDALNRLIAAGQSQPAPAGEPFITANPRFDDIAPGAQAQAWFPASVLEQFELISHFSSRWQLDHGHALRWLCHSPYAHPQIVRRLLLRAVIDGETDVPTLNWVRGNYPHLNPEALEGARLLEMTPPPTGG